MHTTLPIVVFNTTALPAVAPHNSLLQLGAVAVESLPPFPIPSAFEAVLKANRRLPAFHKLSLWAMISYQRIVFLDLDVLELSNLDEMGTFPGDT